MGTTNEDNDPQCSEWTIPCFVHIIYMFHTIPRINCKYFPENILKNYLCDKDALFSVRYELHFGILITGTSVLQRVKFLFVAPFVQAPSRPYRRY